MKGKDYLNGSNGFVIGRDEREKGNGLYLTRHGDGRDCVCVCVCFCVSVYVMQEFSS